jgi:N-acetyl-gamma-glutamyl-phosphate reductase
MEQEISLLCKKAVAISFTPHLLPISRGILSTIYAKLTGLMSDSEVNEVYKSFYKDETFVRLCNPGSYPATQFVKGSNYCDIGVKIDNRTRCRI